MPGSAADPSFPLLPLLSFAFSASATPGPNNIMMLSAAAAHGLRRTLPQLAGVAIGFGLMVALVACGLGVPLTQSRMLQRVLQVGGGRSGWLGSPGRSQRRWSHVICTLRRH